MKRLIVAAVALSSLISLAGKPVAKKVLSEQEYAARKAAKAEKEYRETGGMVKRPGTQKGRIVFVNAQKRADEAILKESAANFENEFHYEIDVEPGTFDIKSPKLAGEATLFVIDDPTLPTLLVAPENRWALVNVAALGGANTKPAYFRARVTKELSRGFALLGGAFLSQFQRTLTECITEPKQLDRYPDWRLPFDTLQKIRKYLDGYGLKPYEPVTYRDACYEGWAAEPKDDVQRAIMKEETAFREKDEKEKAAKAKSAK